MASQIKITFTGGSLLGEERTLPLDGFAVLGRSHSAAVRLKEPDVSGRHLEFREEADGVHAVCLSRNGFNLNGANVCEGESRVVRADDVLMLGTRVRIRIDSVMTGGRPSPSASDEATFATRAIEPSATATVATQFATPDRVAAASASETFATLVADAEAIAAAGNIHASMEETPLGEADSTAPVAVNSPSASSPADEAPTQDEQDVETSVDVSADFGVPDDSPDAQTTGSASGSADGETVEMKTRQASMDEIFRMKAMLEAKKRFRVKMVGFAILVFFVVLGMIVFVNWPREERYLSHPTRPGTNEADVSLYKMKYASGETELIVDYPNAPGMSVDEGASGVNVSTATGKRRNVPFRLSFVKRTDVAQLRKSLSECVQAEVDELSSRGYSFTPSSTDVRYGGGVGNGPLFFEREYPGSCAVKLQCGTPFYRCEFIREDSGLKWHGLMILFRNQATVYRLLREIPDDAWIRGERLLTVDPNIGLTARFIKERWESPGEDGLLHDCDFDFLAASVRADLEHGRSVDWLRTGQKIDTLMVMSFSSSESRQKMATELFERFRSAKSSRYNEFRNKYEIGEREQDEEAMLEAFEECRGAFGNDPSDLRSIKVNDPEEWSCRIER